MEKRSAISTFVKKSTPSCLKWVDSCCQNIIICNLVVYFDSFDYRDMTLRQLPSTFLFFLLAIIPKYRWVYKFIHVSLCIKFWIFFKNETTGKTEWGTRTSIRSIWSSSLHGRFKWIKISRVLHQRSSTSLPECSVFHQRTEGWRWNM